jgi:hypothetical protein
MFLHAIDKTEGIGKGGLGLTHIQALR